MLIDDLVCDLLEDRRVGSDEIALYVAIAHERDELDLCDVATSELGDRFGWARNRVLDARRALVDAGYLTLAERPGRHPAIRLVTPCGEREHETTGDCALSRDPRDLNATPPGDPRDLNAGRDLPSELSTPDVNSKPAASSDDADDPQCPQGSTTTRENPPTPHAATRPVGDVDPEAPPRGAAPGDQSSSIVHEAIELLADRELDNVFMSGRRVNDRDQLRRHIIGRLTGEQASTLERLARTVDVSCGSELLAARQRAVELQSARAVARTWAHLQGDIEITGLAANQFRHAVDPVAATAACIDTYRTERPAGRQAWRERADAFGRELAARRTYTTVEVEQRAVQRFGFDDDLTEIALAAWNAVDARKASA